jgi:hypothetical protein
MEELRGKKHLLYVCLSVHIGRLIQKLTHMCSHHHSQTWDVSIAQNATTPHPSQSCPILRPCWAAFCSYT